jgi:hypothetical protein
MAGLFRFRRKSRPDAGSAPSHRTSGLDIVPDFSGVKASDGSVEWSSTSPNAPTAPTAPTAAPASTAGAGSGRSRRSGPELDVPGTEQHERSDPALAATDGMWEVIRPAAIVPEHAARRVLVELARRDLTNGGEWQSEPQLWSRYDGPLTEAADPPELMGTIHVTYGTPTKYEITLYRVTVTAAGVGEGWTVASLTDEALGFGGLSLAECPRATVITPPRPYTY